MFRRLRRDLGYEVVLEGTARLIVVLYQRDLFVREVIDRVFDLIVGPPDAQPETDVEAAPHGLIGDQEIDISHMEPIPEVGEPMRIDQRTRAGKRLAALRR